MPNTQSLSVIANQYLDNIPVFKMNATQPQTTPDNARRQVLRSMFQPLVLYFVDHGDTSISESRSPESILNTVVGTAGLQLDESLVKEIKEQYREPTSSEQAKDWLKESLEISLADDTHPIKKLSQIVTGKLSENARKELTRLSIVVDL